MQKEVLAQGENMKFQCTTNWRQQLKRYVRYKAGIPRFYSSHSDRTVVPHLTFKRPESYSSGATMLGYHNRKAWGVQATGIERVSVIIISLEWEDVLIWFSKTLPQMKRWAKHVKSLSETENSIWKHEGSECRKLTVNFKLGKAFSFLLLLVFFLFHAVWGHFCA